MHISCMFCLFMLKRNDGYYRGWTMGEIELEAVAELDAVYILRSRESRRLKIKFSDTAAMDAALAAESVGTGLAVIHRERHVISVEVEAGAMTSFAESFTSLQDVYGARIVEDFRYELEGFDFLNPASFSPDSIGNDSLDEVVEQIKATAAWGESRGRGVIIAIVDSGVDGTRPEFGVGRRHAGWAPIGENPWTDWQGHGSMCACIAAGSKADGGVFDGVAPEAMIMPCRTHYFDTELAAIYDALRDLARDGYTVVANNSFGIRTGTPPSAPEDSDFIPALEEAIAAGVHVFFSAGNYHHLAGGAPEADTPNSIWLHKGRADVLTVGASRPDGSMWYYSSRGPGQFSGEANTNDKPDVLGVTPPFGRVVYGGEIKVLDDGWGTSGCCPQVAGMAALMLSKRAAAGGPPLDRAGLFDAIRQTSVSLGLGPESQGTGLIDCEAALAAL